MPPPGGASPISRREGWTAAIWAANAGANAITAFAAAGGQFTDQQNKRGHTAAFYAAAKGAAAITAFAAAGGRFADQQDQNGQTAAFYAVNAGVEAIAAFVKVGGQFPDQRSQLGYTAAATDENEQDRSFDDALRQAADAAFDQMLAESGALPAPGKDCPIVTPDQPDGHYRLKIIAVGIVHTEEIERTEFVRAKVCSVTASGLTEAGKLDTLVRSRPAPLEECLIALLPPLPCPEPWRRGEPVRVPAGCSPV